MNMQIRYYLVVTAICLAIVGCSTVEWMHPTKDHAQYESDLAACERSVDAKKEAISGAYTKDGGKAQGIRLVTECLSGEGWEQKRRSD